MEVIKQIFRHMFVAKVPIFMLLFFSLPHILLRMINYYRYNANLKHPSKNVCFTSMLHLKRYTYIPDLWQR